MIRGSFDHSLPAKKLEELLDKVADRYAETLPKKPGFKTTKLTRLDRTYMFYIYVEDPQDIFRYQTKNTTRNHNSMGES